MKVKKISIEPLESKHYSTNLVISVADEIGIIYDIGVEVYGYYPEASQRAVDKGWEPDWGMDHVESSAVYKIALAIEEALKERAFNT